MLRKILNDKSWTLKLADDLLDFASKIEDKFRRDRSKEAESSELSILRNYFSDDELVKIGIGRRIAFQPKLAELTAENAVKEAAIYDPKIVGKWGYIPLAGGLGLMGAGMASFGGDTKQKANAVRITGLGAISAYLGSSSLPRLEYSLTAKGIKVERTPLRKFFVTMGKDLAKNPLTYGLIGALIASRIANRHKEEA